MNRIVLLFSLVVLSLQMAGQEFVQVPRAWKWTGNESVVFSYDGTYEDSLSFSVDARTGKRTEGVMAPEKYSEFPVRPEGAVNLTYSPDSTLLAFTRNNDLYVVDIASGRERRLTYDGSDVILNGYASWVYYEEIFGRQTRYRAFWWSPDSRKLAFYRFDNSQVPVFPIYSAFSASSDSEYQSPRVRDLSIGGSLSQTRYPKSGQINPSVQVFMADLSDVSGNNGQVNLVRADFEDGSDQYFGPPFWSPDSREFFVPRMPRLQNTLDLYAVSLFDGSRRHVYKETSSTWLNWIYSAVFTDKGLYMVREFETGWQQIYFLSYDGGTFRRLTDGPNWNISLLRIDEKADKVYFTCVRDAVARHALYVVDGKGNVTALTDPAFNVASVRFSPDGKYFVASYSNMRTPVRVGIFRSERSGRKEIVVADMKGPEYDPSAYALPEMVFMTTEDGFRLPGMIVYPKNFDPSVKYPVHMDIYGGPGTPVVRDRWVTPDENNQWWSENGIVQITVDPRAAGHNGREGLDMIYRQLTVNEVRDFCAWADWLKAQTFVDGDKIGVEGFSFGGTMTAMLVIRHSDKFHFGVAGGGVYDWSLYDSHYTERYMDTPQNNPQGYDLSRVLNYVSEYPSEASDLGDKEVMLKLTHGTGDDNVHHQNTLLLVDELHRQGKDFELMIYPDGMHGYHGYQGEHFRQSNRAFWLRYLKP